MAEESAATEQETTPASPEERNGSGHGFLLGMVLGVVAGAAAATLFAPATGDELRQRITEEAAPGLTHPEGEGGPEGAQPDTAVERIRAVLARVRTRVQEASQEGREAAREAEKQGHARYAELTHQE
jgi:gas vesicle protein